MVLIDGTVWAMLMVVEAADMGWGIHMVLVEIVMAVVEEKEMMVRMG